MNSNLRHLASLDRWEVAILEHEAMLNALRRRDGGMLSAILKTHLKHKREEIERAGFAEE